MVTVKRNMFSDILSITNDSKESFEVKDIESWVILERKVESVLMNRTFDTYKSFGHYITVPNPSNQKIRKMFAIDILSVVAGKAPIISNIDFHKILDKYNIKVNEEG